MTDKGSGITDQPWRLVQSLFERFEPIDPALLASRTLLRRVDTKYVLSCAELGHLLSGLSQSYGILFSGSSTWGRYCTSYLDSPDLDCFHDHRRGRRVRFKVRFRHYLDRELSFLEVKMRGKPGVTHKVRRPKAFLSEELTAADLDFVSNTIAPRRVQLAPQLRVEYRRIMLVGKSTAERVSIDLGLQFSHGDVRRSFDNAVIVEVKQERLTGKTPVLEALRERRVRPGRTSKYCIGTILLKGNVRMNRLRPAVLSLERAENG